MDDIDGAFERLRRVIADAPVTGDWGSLADPLTEDVLYRITGMPAVRGREAVRQHFEAVGSTFPGTLIVGIDLLWHALDRNAPRVVFEVRHRLRDPGDGSQHFAQTTCLATYAGDGLWSAIDDTFNPESYRAMFRSWVRASHACGTVDVDHVVLETFDPSFSPLVRPIDVGHYSGRSTDSSSRTTR